MTVIAWDGKTLAADRMLIRCDTLGEITKAKRLSDGRAVAIAGNMATGLLLIKLLEEGRLVDAWPEVQSTNDWSTLIVARQDGTLEYYEKERVPTVCETSIMAWGVGREAALGAMEMGADAVHAIKVASKWVLGCGKGFDAFELTAGQFVHRSER